MCAPHESQVDFMCVAHAHSLPESERPKPGGGKRRCRREDRKGVRRAHPARRVSITRRMAALRCSAARSDLYFTTSASDIEGSTRFYTDGLGLTLSRSFSHIIGHRAAGTFPSGVASVFLEAGAGRYIELRPAGDATMSPPGFPLNHLAFGVADVNAAYARALAAGAKSVEIPVPDEQWDETPSMSSWRARALSTCGWLSCSVQAGN